MDKEPHAYYQLSCDDHHVQHGVPEDVLIVRVRSLQGGGVSHHLKGQLWTIQL